MCVLVLDDFFDDLKASGSKMWSTAKQFVADNKHVIYPLVTNLIRGIHPGAGNVIEGALSAFGGTIQSEDPYAVDIKYMEYIFGIGPARPLGRY
jgi:hypothetical protein